MLRRFIILIAAVAATINVQAQHPDGDFNKMSPYLQRIALMANQRQKVYGNGTRQAVCALIKFCKDTDAEVVLQRHASQMIDRIGRIVIADICPTELKALAQEECVERIEAERLPHASMNVTPGYVNATEVFTGEELPQAYTGSGVVAGSLDCGHDFTHPSFYTPDGKCRIKYFCDFNLNDDEGHPGRVFDTTDEIVLAEHSQTATSQNHGTHVLGIMAGSVVGSFRGMASDADICLADFNSDREEFFPTDAGLTSAICILGFKRIFDYAETHGMPCVINFSNGESVMYYNDHLLESEAINELLGPGRIIVAAQGNEGTDRSYLYKAADTPSAGALTTAAGLLPESVAPIDVRTQGDLNVTLGFYSQTDSFVTTTFSTTEINEAAGLPINRSINVDGTEIPITAQRVSCLADTAGAVYHFEMQTPSYYFLFNTYGYVLLSGNAEAEAVSDILVNPMVNYESPLDAAQQGFSVSWPATLPRVIGVGAMNANRSIVSFSSAGPTYDFRTKPDVAAPGYGIYSSRNSFLRTGATGIGEVSFHGKTYDFIRMSGTSMASPVVAGTVALWLQAKPDLTPEEVLQVISETSKHPDNTLAYPNNRYGHGLIDVYQGLLKVLGLTDAIPTLSLHQPKEARFSLNGRQLRIDLPDSHQGKARLSIYSTSGQLLESHSFCGASANINLASLPAAVYAVQLNTSNGLTTGSTLIRIQ